MADLMKFSNGVLFWDLTLRRYSEDWELESFYSLMSRIYGASLKGVGDDKCVGNRLWEWFCYSFLLPSADKKFRLVFPLEDCLEV